MGKRNGVGGELEGRRGARLTDVGRVGWTKHIHALIVQRNSRKGKKIKDCYLQPISKLLQSHFLVSDACWVPLLSYWSYFIFLRSLYLLHWPLYVLPPFVSCGGNGENGCVVSTEAGEGVERRSGARKWVKRP